MTVAEALEWVRAHRIVLQAAKVAGVPSLAHEIVQGPIKGSWWGHPKGKEIFRVASAVDDSGEVVAFKLIEGKTTYVHRSLWPALARVLLDDAWRAPRVARLNTVGKKLYAQVERDGEVGAAEAKALKSVEAELLALVVSQHTEKGHHEKVATSWERWAKAAKVKPAGGSLEEAIEKVREAAHGIAVL